MYKRFKNVLHNNIYLKNVRTKSIRREKTAEYNFNIITTTIYTQTTFFNIVCR